MKRNTKNLDKYHILSGTLESLSENIVDGIKKETKKNYKLICTGGLANLFAKSISSKSIIDKNLTIKGILEIYKLNKFDLLKNG